MTHSLTPKFKPSDADTAYEILAAQGRPMYYYDLIQEVLNRQGITLYPAHISAVLTQINLDTRFSYLGKGEWGLKVWVPTKGSRKISAISLMNKELAYDDADLEDKDPLLDLDEELEEELGDEIEEDPFEKEPAYKGRQSNHEDESW